MSGMLEAIEMAAPGVNCRVKADSSIYFAMLEDWFPMIGSKIAWSKVENSIDRQILGADWKTFGNACVALIDELVK